jgi:lysophospholipase L1-like esterase
VTTLNAFAFQENQVAEGNVTADRSVEATATTTAWYFLSGVSVSPRTPDAAAVVALGDSITNGANTRTGANHRWPDLLSNRFQARDELRRLGVLNLGVAGNRLLHDPNPPAGNPAEGFAAFFGQSALRRFDRDVASQPGARYLVTLIGVNDLGHPGTSAPKSETVSASELIEGHRQLIERAHALGIKAYGGTILPFKGDTLGFHSAVNERKRQKLNRWIRHSGAYDAVIDFAAAVKDPEHPLRLLPRYDSGDHLHPNDVGMRALARAVPLRLFR